MSKLTEAIHEAMAQTEDELVAQESREFDTLAISAAASRKRYDTRWSWYEALYATCTEADARLEYALYAIARTYRKGY